MSGNIERDHEKNTLYKLGGIFSFLTVLTIILSIAAFFFYPPFPKDIFQVIRNNTLAGLLSLDFLYLLAVLFTLPVIMALYFSLNGTGKTISLLALVFGIIGVVLLIQARPIMEMFSLSDYLANSTSDIEKSAITAHGNILI